MSDDLSRELEAMLDRYMATLDAERAAALRAARAEGIVTARAFRDDEGRPWCAVELMTPDGAEPVFEVRLEDQP